MDITDLIMNDHQWQRNLFALLDTTHRDGSRTLGAIRRSPAVALEVHARIEEELFYPRLLNEVTDGRAETEDAVSDNKPHRISIPRRPCGSTGTTARSN